MDSSVRDRTGSGSATGQGGDREGSSSTSAAGAPRSAPGPGSEQPLFERDGQLRLLDGLLAEVRAGEGRFAVIEGPAGIGKTALLDAVRTQAGDAGLTVLSARGTELERDFPFGVVRQLFEPTLAAGDEAARAGLLSGAAAAAGPLFGYGAHDQPPVEAGAMGAADTSFASLHGLYWLSSNLCDRDPLLLAIDDLQWADPASLRFLRFLLPRLLELPALLLAAVRSEELPGSGSLATVLADPLTMPIGLEPLSEDAVRELAATSGAELVPDALRACHQATGGNPFLVEELLRDVAARGAAGIPASAELIRGAPSSVTRSVSLRLSSLGERAAALAGAVAIVGDDADPRLAARVAGLEVGEASRLADALAGAGLLSPGQPYSFLHPLVRGAVYSSLPAAERAAAHERAAALLEEDGAGPGTIALHLLGTEPAGRESVASTLRAAAREALESGATDTALTLLRRALAEPPPDEAIGELLLDFGVTGIWAASPEGIPALRRVIEIGEPRAVARATSILAAALVMTGAADQGVAVLDRGLRQIRPSDPEGALRVEAEVAVLALMDASTHQAAADRIERLPERGDTSATSRHLLAARAFDLARRGEPADEVTDTAARALAGEEPLGGSVAFWQALSALLVGDRLELAGRALDRAASEPGARAPGVRLILNASLRSRLAYLSGRIPEAETTARLAVDAASMVELVPFMPHAVGYLIDALVERGEVEAAAAVDGRLADPPPTLAGSILLFSRSRLRLAQGRTDEGVQGLLELAERNRRIGLLNPAYLPWASTAAGALAGAERPEPIRDALAEELDRARRWGTPRAIGLALRAQGLMDGDAGSLREAVRLLGASPARLEQARALVDLGAHLRRSNRRSDAREHLRHALERGTSCAAVALADRARVELLAAGARPNQPRGSGADTLTPSERRVCELAREGLSNPEIAQQLFVTKKTVEYHLSNAYRKLEIGSRADLAGALTEAATAPD